jgi:hypothetical protein
MIASRTRWPYRIPLGVALGLLASAAILAVLPCPGRSVRRENGRLLSECNGCIREVVIHYVAEAAEVLSPVYCDFLRQLPADVLNEEAARVWSELGYDVRRVRCDSCYRYFGTLHCLVNVLRRDM